MVKFNLRGGKRKIREALAVLALAAATLAAAPEASGQLRTEANTGDADEAEEQLWSSLMAQSAVLLDGDSGRVLFGKNEDTVRPMASTTKIMTCIVALENASPEDTVEVSACAASMPDVQLNIRAGETYRLKDLLYSLMLESHNDSAVAVAEHVAGSQEAFADLMNQKARDIGCVSTYFITPNGLDASDPESGESHATTAAELAKLLRYCIALSPMREQFLEITQAPSHTFSDLAGTRFFSCINHNALLTSMEGAISGKTGFTNAAGYCYVGAVKKGEKTLIAALLGCGWPPHKTWKWQDMKKLVEYGDKNFDYYEIRKEEIRLEPVPVRNGISPEAGLFVEYPEGPLTVLMKKSDPVTVRTKTVSQLTAPVEEGMVAGQADYYVGGDLVASYPVKTTERIGEWTWEFCVKSLLNQYFI